MCCCRSHEKRAISEREVGLVHVYRYRLCACTWNIFYAVLITWLNIIRGILMHVLHLKVSIRQIFSIIRCRFFGFEAMITYSISILTIFLSKVKDFNSI